MRGVLPAPMVTRSPGSRPSSRATVSASQTPSPSPPASRSTCANAPVRPSSRTGSARSGRARIGRVHVRPEHGRDERAQSRDGLEGRAEGARARSELGAPANVDRRRRDRVRDRDRGPRAVPAHILDLVRERRAPRSRDEERPGRCGYGEKRGSRQQACENRRVAPQPERRLPPERVADHRRRPPTVSPRTRSATARRTGSYDGY